MSASPEWPAPAPQRPQAGHKGTSGRLLVIAGSPEMPGAALLAARAAQRAGAGLVRVLDVDQTFALLLPLAAPEAVRLICSDQELDEAWFAGRDERALLIGPGLGLRLPADGSVARTRRWVTAALERFPGPVLLDADALNAFPGEAQRLRRGRHGLVLTPHPLEAARLLGRELGAEPEQRAAAARELAQQTGGVCLLKGAGTLIDDGRRSALNPTGSPALSTAGSGDVLSGLLAAYLCALSESFDCFAAARAAAWVHGRAGELCAARLGERGTIASDLIEALPQAQLQLEAASR